MSEKSSALTGPLLTAVCSAAFNRDLLGRNFLAGPKAGLLLHFSGKTMTKMLEAPPQQASLTSLFSVSHALTKLRSFEAS